MNIRTTKPILRTHLISTYLYIISQVIRTSGVWAILIVFALLPNHTVLALEFSAGRVYSTFAEGNEQTVLQDSAEVENEDIRITAETIRLSGDNNRYIAGEGNIVLFDKKSEVELSASVFQFDTEEESLILEGNAQFKDIENDILIKSSFLERQPDLVIFQLNVQITRENMLANAEYVRFFEDSNRLELSGFPVVYYNDDEYSADVISVNTDTNEIILEGEVKGQLSGNEEETQ